MMEEKKRSRKDRPPLCPSFRSSPVPRSLNAIPLKIGVQVFGQVGDRLSHPPDAVATPALTPLKGIVRFQICEGDLDSMLWLIKSALQELKPINCQECGESRLTSDFIIFKDATLCRACAFRTGKIEYHPEAEKGRRWW